ncbi:MAG: hypothetical protein IJQ39_09855 [Thermoguttaceae bacterium]|nr:hypothetical protein [Thermoguttaceae bacterium]
MNDNKNDWTAYFDLFRFLNWNSGGSSGWFGKLIRFVCNLAILTIIVNLLGGFILSLAIDWTEPPCMPLGDGSALDNDLKIQYDAWIEKKRYWQDSYHVNLDVVNKNCREFNQEWANVNLYWRQKAIEYWNKTTGNL